MVHGLAVAKRTVGLQYNTFTLEVRDGVLSVEEGVDFNLINNWFGYNSIIKKFFVV